MSKSQSVRTALIGRKVGMSQLFSEEGGRVPVTVLQVGPCVVVSRRKMTEEGGVVVQLGFEEKKPSRVSKPMRGHFAAAGVTPKRFLKEFRVAGSDDSYQPGEEVTVDRFSVGSYVDVTGRTIGKGFAGVIKRWGFRGGRGSHGAHKIHRSPGSIGQCQDPGRVFKGKKMAGHMGDRSMTVQNLRVVGLDESRHLMFVKGSVPGFKGGVITVREAVKKRRLKAE